MARKIAGIFLLLLGLFNILGIIVPLARGAKLQFPPLYYLVVIGIVI